MAAEAIRTGMGEKVTASHTAAFGSYDNAYLSSSWVSWLRAGSTSSPTL
jgi:hypothetical protein